MFEAIQSLLKRIEERRTRPKPIAVLRGHAGSLYGRYLKRLRQGSKPGQLDAENRAKRLAAQIQRKFATSSRQQRRRALFRQMFAEVSKMYGREPRRARRKIARAWAKRPAEEVAA